MRREVKRHMKHVKVLSSSKPAPATQVSWLELKNFIGPIKLRPAQTNWLLSLIDNFLQS